MLSSPSPRKRKPGPKPSRPTKRQRRHVELAVAGGMSLESIADAIECHGALFTDVFAESLRLAGRRKLLAHSRAA